MFTYQFHFIWRNIWLLLVSVIKLWLSPAPSKKYSEYLWIGIPVIFAIIVYIFIALSYKSTKMELYDSYNDITKDEKKRLENGRETEWPSTKIWVNIGQHCKTSLTSTPVGGASELQISLCCFNILIYVRIFHFG